MNLLGDPEVSIWIGQPKAISYSIQYNGQYSFEIGTDGTPLDNAIITITDETGLIDRIQTDQDGLVQIPYSWLTLTDFTLAILHQGCLPVIKHLQSFHELNRDFNYFLLPLEVSFDPDISGFIYPDELLTVYWEDYSIDNLLSKWYYLEDSPIVFPSTLTPNLMSDDGDQYTFPDIPVGIHYISLMFENATAGYYTESYKVEVRERRNIPGYSPIILLGISIIAIGQFITKKND